MFGKSPSKLSSVLKKKSVHEKLSTAVNSMKNIHRVKTGNRGNLTNISSLNSWYFFQTFIEILSKIRQ